MDRVAERWGAPEAQGLRDQLSTSLVEILERHDGAIDTVTDDEIVSVFGVPVCHENDPELALRAACEILGHVREISGRHAGEIVLHGGIHTGLVVTQEIGAITPPRFCLVGTTVDLASLLAHAAGREEILASWETYEQVAEQFVFEPVGPLRLRGFDQPQRAFRLVGLNPEPQAIVPPPRAIRVPLIGRSEELRLLQLFLGERSAEGRCQALLLRADMGMGKTRIVSEAVSRFAPAAHFHRSAGARWAQRVSLFAVIELLRQVLEISPLDRASQITAKVESALRELNTESEIDALCLRHLLGDPDAAQILVRETPDHRRHLIFQAVLHLFRALSRERPLILLFDDLQWVDSATESFLGELLGAEGLGECWVILASRRDHPDLTAVREIATLTLPSLSDRESRLLLENVLEQIGVSAELRRLIIRRSEGNPLFLEELARMVIDDLLERPPEEREEIVQRLGEGVPQSLHNLIQGRVDRLEMKTRLLLQCGAVMGGEFVLEALTLVECIREGLMDKLITLESLQILIRREREGILRFYFRNSLTQEIVYRSMLRRQREQMHEMVAGALGRLFAQRRREYAAQIAFHWEQAGDPRRAAEHLLEAARRACDLGDLPLAELQVEAVIEHLSGESASEDDLRTMVEALLLSGAVHRLEGKLADSQRRLHSALHAARHLDDGEMISRALLENAHTLLQRGRPGWARRLLGQALALPDSNGNGRQRALCLQQLAIIDWQQGHPLEAERHLREVGVDAEQEPVIASDTHNNLGLILWSRGDLPAAHNELQRAMELRRRAGQIFGEIATASNLGIVAEQMGRFHEADERYRWALGRARALGYRVAETALCANLANLALLARRWQRALEQSARAEEVAHRIGDRRSEAIALENRALAEAGLGERAAAGDSFTRAAEIALSLRDRERQASLALGRAGMCLDQGNLQEAIREVNEAQGHIESEDLGHLRPTLLSAEAQIALAEHDRERAIEQFREALALSRGTHQRADEMRVLRALIEAAPALGIADKEENELRMALQEIERGLEA
ncbi:tetratricopeptide repeat protein [Candidatus Sumerlaeota bacterium]|nr:tetratricopeptide repeat protein [Candidatus Sumerlaeota bacterium]